MDKIIKNINCEKEIQEFINIIKNIQTSITNKHIQTTTHNGDIKQCTYIYGDNGVGKTTFIKNVLSRLNYNIHEFTLLCPKNKTIVDFYDEYNCHNRNIMDIFNKKSNSSVIFIDNIDLINSVDKNTLSSLIKILRAKKTKKNINEKILNTQIIIIGTNDSDKKIKELLKLSNVFKIESPKREDIYKNIISAIKNYKCISNNSHSTDGNDGNDSTDGNDICFTKSCKINKFLDANKNINYYLIDKFIYLYKSNTLDLFFKYNIDNVINNNVKHINYDILKARLDFNDDNSKINDTDRTTVSLIYHENIIDYICYKHSININLYKSILENFCFGDYIDRIIFQKQLWQLNEISFKIKVVYNNIFFHDYLEKYNIRNNVRLNNIRFTKILTKYSSEFNNNTFLINMCQTLDIDKKDLLLVFFYLKNCVNTKIYQQCIDAIINKYNISILDINRLIKFISVLSFYEE